MKRIFVITISSLLALSLFVACLAEQPLTVEELLDLGEKFLLEHDYEQALVHFQEVIEIEPMNPRGYTGAAEAFMGMDRIDDADATLQEGISTLPGNPDITQVLSGMYIDSGKYDEAMELIGKGLAFVPNHPVLSEMQDELARLMHTHSWEEASCQNPQTCTECGETEGDTIKHVWVTANLQAPRHCSLCGEAHGNPLTPGYEKFEIAHTDLLLDVPVDMLIWDGRAYTGPVGELILTEYDIFDSNEEFEAIEGYVYHKVKCKFIFSGRVYEYYSSFDLLDYYVINWNDDGDSPWFDNGYMYTVNFTWDPWESHIPGLYRGTFMLDYYGMSYEFYYAVDETRAVIDGKNTITFDLVFSVPTGYDGLILRFSGLEGAPSFRLNG